MNKEERNLCKKLLRKTKSNEITWQTSNGNVFTAEVDGLDLQIGCNESFGPNGSTTYYYYLDVKNGEGSTRLDRAIVEGLLLKSHPLRDMHDFLRLEVEDEEKTREETVRNRLVTRLATMIK